MSWRRRQTGRVWAAVAAVKVEVEGCEGLHAFEHLRSGEAQVNISSAAGSINIKHPLPPLSHPPSDPLWLSDISPSRGREEWVEFLAVPYHPASLSALTVVIEAPLSWGAEVKKRGHRLRADCPLRFYKFEELCICTGLISQVSVQTSNITVC